MQQLFDNRKYSARDFEEWDEKESLYLQPNFQRREVWSETAKAFLIDTMLRGKPIPKIYMRVEIDPGSRRTRREIVDGQQRIRTVLDFLRDGFRVRRTHNRDLGGKCFSELDEDTQKAFLGYEFSVDLLHDVPDAEIYDIFARLNTYSVKLKDQELRNASWHGEFKSMVYSLSSQFTTFWLENGIFTRRSMLRMEECEFTSELLIAMMSGVAEGSKPRIDRQYRDYDREGSIPNRDALEDGFKATMDTIGAIFGDRLQTSGFNAARLYYPLFCSIYHCLRVLPGAAAPRPALRESQYPRIRTALDSIVELLRTCREAKAPEGEALPGATAEEWSFYKAYSEHWVHAEERRTLFNFIHERVRSASGGGAA